VEGYGLHKEEKWRGLCTSLPFFFLETELEGEGNGRRGRPRHACRPHGAWQRPGRRGKWRGGQGGPVPALTSCGDGLRRVVHGDGWWPAMVSGGGELQCEVEEGRCWGSVGGVRGGSGADLWAGRERGDGRHGRVTGSTGTSLLMAVGMLGDKAQAARARGRDGDGPAQQHVARRLGVHGQQARSGTASSSGRGMMRAA
jgi:hypothetical protein